MARALSALAVALLVVGVLVMPEPDPNALAIQRAYRMLAEHPVEVDGETIPLGALAFRTEAFTETAPGAGELNLLGTWVDGEPVDRPIHAELRDAIVRGLYAAARSEGIELSIPGDFAPTRTGGLTFLLSHGGGELSLLMGMPDEIAEDADPRAEPHVVEWKPPDSTSLLPPIVAIGLALVLRRPVISLFAGVLVAAWLLERDAGAGVVVSVGTGLLDVFRVFFWGQFSDQDRAETVGFVVAMLAMVGVVTRNGGIQGVMDAVARLANDARRTQIATYAMGLLVFFDDYANTILVGGTMRPLSDRFRVAREKLAYIVDSTAAPVAGLSLFSTWIAFEVSTFSAQLPSAGLSPDDGYSVFIETLPFRFYCLLTLLFVATVCISGRDFGTMRAAEVRARRTGRVVREGGTPMVGELATAMRAAPGIGSRAVRAVVPIAAFVGLTLFWILWSGGAFAPGADLGSLAGIADVLSNAGITRGLLIGSTAGLALAVLQSLAAGMRGEIVRAAWTTLRSMGIAILILYLAWMIGAACGELQTAAFLTAAVGEELPPAMLPTVLLLLSAVVAFSTGSSWSTMSILLPLVVGLAYTLGERGEIGGHLLMVMSIGAVLEGSIFGDHCSPLSDTTVLSSIATASDHIDHVRTQAPYAVITMLIAIAAGYLPCAVLGWHPAAALATGAAAVVAIVLLVGRGTGPERTDAASP